VSPPLQAKKRRPFEAQDKQDRRTPNGYQINFSANCSWRLLAAVLLMVLNSPKLGGFGGLPGAGGGGSAS